MAQNATTLRKPPSANCGGFIDSHRIWNNGFACPIQYVCCGSDHSRYCCPLDHYLSEINSYSEQIYVSGLYQPSSEVLVDRNSTMTSMKNVNERFEQFQKLFLPIFLLTSSILFLVGIAIWFWLYKHKAFYATERENVNRLKTKGSRSPLNDYTRKKRESINLTMDQQSRRISHPSTEV